MMSKNQYPVLFSIVTLFILVGSCILTRDRSTWVLEVFPILLGFPILFFTYKRFPLTNLLYALIIVHFTILAVGGIYTYAEVPLGYWMKDWFHFSRNHYDRIGHFAQGFIPAVLVREILLRTTPLRQGKMLFFIVVCICLAVSAFYEFIEWWTVLIKGSSAEAFLGTQGDVWDAHWDMFFAMIGAITAMIIMPRFHDKFLAKYQK